MTHELELRRIIDNTDATAGYLIEKAPYAAFIGFTLEDQKQLGPKIKGETRIPAGRYRLTLNKTLTNLTKSYQERYKDWFKYHIMLNDVAGFSGIYIHIGNDDDDTDGCLLLGDQLHNPLIYRIKPLQRSTDAFRRFYEKYYPIIDNNEIVYLTVVDERF